MPLPQDTVLNHYTITSTIQAGGFGVTYCAVDNKTGEVVAIKENYPSYLVTRAPDGSVRLTGELSEFELASRHFLREAKILSKLNHPGVVSVTDYFSCFGTDYYVMEYVDGSPLHAVSSSIYGSDESLANLLLSLADALTYIHSHSVYHRDIKPANIMLRSGSSEPVLIDFGAARCRTGFMNHSVSNGVYSEGYSSPEQMANDGKEGPWMDIYSLGATFYRLLTGMTPPNASARLISDRAVLLAADRHLTRTYSPALLSCIDKAFAVRQADRYRTAAEMASEIRASLAPAAEPERSPLPATPAVHLRERSRREPERDYRRPSVAPVAADDDIIPVPVIMHWAAVTCFLLGVALTVPFLFSLFGSVTQDHIADWLVLLGFPLLILSCVLRIIRRFVPDEE